MYQYYIEDDCEDQGFSSQDYCSKWECQEGFKDGKPVYPKLILEGVFWCCPKCHGSYGENPHVNCPSMRK